MLAVERCHLGIEAVIATPYAAGLSALVDDEADMGCAVVDMGGGTTSVGIFSNGHLVHTDAIAVGGHHVTMDIARGLTTRVSAAERLKTFYGSAIASSADDRDMIAVPQVDEDERDVPNHLPKSHLVRIIKPRVEEVDRKSTRLNSSHANISYAVFCLKKKKVNDIVNPYNYSLFLFVCSPSFTTSTAME